MSESTDPLLHYFLHQSHLKDFDTEALQTLAQEHPYFGVTQLLLLKKLDENSEAYTAQKQRAALFVYQPWELSALLSDAPVFDVKAPESTTAAPQETAVEETKAPTDALQSVAAKEREETIEAPQKENKKFAEPAAPELDVKLPSFTVPAPAVNASAVTFEPYHTVDYFASQGIKLSQNEVGNDRFGKQLKSFTEWLKTMKKVPTTAITQNTDGIGEKKVENLAAHSLQGDDVITESMAEVWVKQGNLPKALEVYNKLSLQNPSKKAYFASKIESLKKPH